MYNKDQLDLKEKPCWFYVDADPIASFREVQNQLSSKDILEKESSLKKILGSIINDENYPDNLMMSAINYLTIVEDIRIKKLLFLFWEVIEKKHTNGKIREEFILVCNSLRKELTHPNEYVRGRVLRLLCKLPYIEILESLKSVIIENLTHKHSYVRKNALLCILSICNNFGPDVLPENITSSLRDIIEKDTDISCKRNAYLALSKINKDESFQVTKEILAASDINEIGDLFILSIVENLRNLCILYPKEKGRMLKILLDLSNHKSHSVLFEVANSLVLLSSNPNIIKTAVGIFCNLLVEQKDNNILIIILKKLINIKKKFRDILEEQILSFAIILNSTTNSDIRKLLFDLIIELLKETNIHQVFDVFINDLNKLRGVSETETNLQFKNMIMDCMHKGLKRFPQVNSNYVIFLLERCILYDSKNTFNNELLNIIKDIFFVFPNLRKDFINKIIQHFDEIQNFEILQLIFWIFAEFIEDDLELLKKTYLIIMKNMGDLNFEAAPELLTSLSRKNLNVQHNEKKVITKTIILADGTYGTQQIILDSLEVNKQKENKFLRNFILESNFFFSTNIVLALTRLVIKIYYVDYHDKKEIYNTFFFNTINIICAILKIKSDKIYKDPDNVNRINFCLECLINKDFDFFLNIINESKQFYNEYYSKLMIEDATAYINENKNRHLIKNADDFMNFRYVKNSEIEAIDLGDDEKIKNNEESNNILFGNNSGNKFIEVITGTEDPLLIEAVVEVFTFDILVEFYVKNLTKNEIHSISLNIFVPENLHIIEQPPIISLLPSETKKVRCCIKFSSTCNCFLFGQVNYANNKGHLNSINISGFYVELLHTYPADISEGHFRKLWIDYNWEHNVTLISKRSSFKEIIESLKKELRLKLVVPSDISMIDEESVFMVSNLYTKTKLGEDALVNISIEKTKAGKVMGSAVIRSRAKEFAQILGDKIKTLIK